MSQRPPLLEFLNGFTTGVLLMAVAMLIGAVMMTACPPAHAKDYQLHNKFTWDEYVDQATSIQVGTYIAPNFVVLRATPALGSTGLEATFLAYELALAAGVTSVEYAARAYDNDTMLASAWTPSAFFEWTLLPECTVIRTPPYVGHDQNTMCEIFVWIRPCIDDPLRTCKVGDRSEWDAILGE